MWFEQLNKMSDGSAGRYESPEKIKFLFLSSNRVSVFTQDAPLNVKWKYCTWILLLSSKLQNLCSFRPTLKTGKTGRFDNHGYKNRRTY